MLQKFQEGKETCGGGSFFTVCGPVGGPGPVDMEARMLPHAAGTADLQVRSTSSLVFYALQNNTWELTRTREKAGLFSEAETISITRAQHTNQ